MATKIRTSRQRPLSKKRMVELSRLSNKTKTTVDATARP